MKVDQLSLTSTPAILVRDRDFQLQRTHIHLNLNNKKRIPTIHVRLHHDVEIRMDVQKQRDASPLGCKLHSQEVYIERNVAP